MNALIFSGQGSQYPGMGKELLDLNPEFTSIYDKASEILGYNLSSICFESDEETLSKTIYSQPAIMITSILCLEVAKKNNLTYNAVAGHSLGEFAAMVAANILSVEDAFMAIKSRATAMDKAANNSSGSMAAILKLKSDVIEKVCNSINGYVTPVNYNSPDQTVIAGETEFVNEAVSELKKLGARAVILKVSSAFHSNLMSSAADEFYNSIKNLNFKTPTVKYYSNVTGAELTDFSDMPSLLAKHIVSPVKFTDELNNMYESGFDTFIELGPNKVLSGLVRKTIKTATVLNIENKETLENFINL